MTRLALSATLAAVLAAGCSHAALPVGAAAPDISTQASLAGKEMPFSLRTALKKGPVVLYFYPAAFTKAARSRRTTSPRRPTISTSSARR